MNPEELWNTTLDQKKKSFTSSIFQRFKRDQSLIHTLMGNDVGWRKFYVLMR